MIDARCLAFLRSVDAQGKRHGKRTLLEHLRGTHGLLQAWGNDTAVCNAGLFHSIYGTRVYTQRTLPLSQRRRVRDLIGREAEYLAYLFCTLERPRALLSAAESKLCAAPLKDGTILYRLLEIECANLLEQNARSGSVRKLYRLALRDRRLLSPGALGALGSYVQKLQSRVTSA
jgi:hypothetical protein